MNIIIIICDALRAQNLGCYGYDKPISPNIDHIASQGAKFNNAFSTTNTTDVSFTTIFTGQYPHIHGLKRHGSEITDKDKSFIDNMKFLPEILHENGYTTVALDWLGRWHRFGYDFYAGQKNYLVDRNAERIHALTPKQTLSKAIFRNFSKICTLPGRGSWYYYLPTSIRQRIRSASILSNDIAQGDFSRKRKPVLSDSAGLSDLAVSYIKQYAQNQNLFLFVHYWDNHIPYTAPKSMVKALMRAYDYSSDPVSAVLSERVGTRAGELIHKTTRGSTPKTLGEIQAHYDASIQYVDDNIGRIYNTVRQMNLLDETLFIITSDHGESLGEHDIYFDHHGLYDPQIRVPLIIKHPAFPAGRSFDELVQHDNLVPTILDLNRIDIGNMTLRGQSLLDITKGQQWLKDFVYVEEKSSQQKRAIRDRRYKYIHAINDNVCRCCQAYHSQTDEFYDLHNDPMESKNIIDNPKSKEYLHEMNHFLGNLPKPQAGNVRHFDDEAIVNQRLQALGYF